MKQFILISLMTVFGAVFLYGCGSNDSDTSSGSGSGQVALYMTDDISDYKEVIATINDVKLLHTGSGSSCDILPDPDPGPVTLDITNLYQALQLISVVDCPDRSYNRLVVEFEKDVRLTDSSDTTATCSFTSYKEQGNSVNRLNCAGNNCTVQLTGAVNVLANQGNLIGLDLDLKEFEVEPEPINPLVSCSVTMKLSPMNSSDMDEKENNNYRKKISGYLSDLDTTADSFTLAKGNKTFFINYSAVENGTNSQAGIDQLLTKAQADHLRARVNCSSLDLSNLTCISSGIDIKAKGTVSDHNGTDHLFKLNYTVGSDPRSMNVDYSQAAAENEVEGTIDNDVFVEVKLYGHAGASHYLAREVEVEDEDEDIDTDD
jgi:hypothetical protein